MTTINEAKKQLDPKYHRHVSDIRGKAYMQVDGRIAIATDEGHQHGRCVSVSTSFEHLGDFVICRAEVETWRGRAVGHAQAFIGGTGVDATSPLENAETSAVGRALGFLGYGLFGNGIASADEVDNAISQQPYTNFRKSTDKQRGYIRDLMKQLGETESSIEAAISSIEGSLWGDASEFIDQLKQRLREVKSKPEDSFTQDDIPDMPKRPINNMGIPSYDDDGNRNDDSNDWNARGNFADQIEPPVHGATEKQLNLIKTLLVERGVASADADALISQVHPEGIDKKGASPVIDALKGESPKVSTLPAEWARKYTRMLQQLHGVSDDDVLDYLATSFESNKMAELTRPQQKQVFEWLQTFTPPEIIKPQPFEPMTQKWIDFIDDIANKSGYPSESVTEWLQAQMEDYREEGITDIYDAPERILNRFKNMGVLEIGVQLNRHFDPVE